MLIPAVVALLRAGKIHEFDAEWIGRLRPKSQLAAAKKCMNAAPRLDIADNAKTGTAYMGRRSR